MTTSAAIPVVLVPLEAAAFLGVFHHDLGVVVVQFVTAHQLQRRQVGMVMTGVRLALKKHGDIDDIHHKGVCGIYYLRSGNTCIEMIKQVHVIYLILKTAFENMADGKVKKKRQTTAQVYRRVAKIY